MISLLGIALARILLVLVAINLTNTLVFDRLEPSFDLSLLDQIPQTRAVIDILTVLIAVFILLGLSLIHISIQHAGKQHDERV